MHRRRIIQSSVLLIIISTGCIEHPSSDNMSSKTSRITTKYGSSTVDSSLEDKGIAYETDIIDPETEDGPAVIRIKLINQNSHSIEFGIDSEGPVTDFVGINNEDSGRIVLVPKNRDGYSVSDENGDGELVVIPDSKKDGCWRMPDEIIKEGLAYTVSLSPGEIYSGEYFVESYRSCAPAGTYVFNNSIDFDRTTIVWNLKIDYPI